MPTDGRAPFNRLFIAVNPVIVVIGDSRPTSIEP